jgi:poly-gamma-glutamate synthase PgsB/CapB
MNAEAVVVECMAIDPHLQFVSETKMIKSTIGVLTNVRPDHLEVMGKNLDDVADSLSQTIPKNAVLVTADQKYFGYFESQAAEKNTKAYLVRETDPGSQQDSKEVLTLKENLLIANKVCSLLNVTPSFTHNGLTNSVTDEGCWNTVEIKNGRKKIHFIDAFSTNDVESTKIVQQIALNKRYCPRPFVALFNNRTDRPLRMLSFVTFISSVPTYDYVMLISDYRKMAKRCIHREGKRGNIFILRSRDPEGLIDEICQQISSPEFTVVGMGNFKGLRGELSRCLSLRGQN